jgi:hypothetical protein
MWMCVHTVPNYDSKALTVIFFSQLISSSSALFEAKKHFLPRLFWYIISYSWVNLFFHDTGLDSGVQWLQMLPSNQGMC